MQSEIIPTAPFFITILFLVLVGFLAFCTLKTLYKTSLKTDSKALKLVAPAIILWVLFLSILSWGGFFTTFDTVPPRLSLILIPALAWLIFLATTTQIKPLLETVSLKSLTYIQAFRTFVELILWLLIGAKAMAPVMTFTGRNFDILIGLSAPLLGYLAFNKHQLKPQILTSWNYLGILVLGVTVFHGVFSAPTLFRIFHEDVSTALIGTFPFALLPGFVVPFAFTCHILSIRKLPMGGGFT